MPKPEKSTDKELAETLGHSAKRKLRARQHPPRSALYGLRLFGLVGWSVAIPTVAGCAVGLWLDRVTQTTAHNWTISLLIGGLVLGCFTAWVWLEKEARNDH